MPPTWGCPAEPVEELLLVAADPPVFLLLLHAPVTMMTTAASAAADRPRPRRRAGCDAGVPMFGVVSVIGSPSSPNVLYQMVSPR